MIIINILKCMIVVELLALAIAVLTLIITMIEGVNDTKVEETTCEMIIDEFCEKLSSRLTEISDNATIRGMKNVDFLTLDTVIDEILDIAGQIQNKESEKK